ncbi:MAG TPA: hypothetical protein VFU59_11540 [Candidatus Eisenbacteria bacterium]|nr:hypothetical protein [Candidatus Eisenbacteria bacterium]
MFQRKLIASLSVIALLAVTAGVGHASLSRVEGMGLSVPALSQLTDDYANIYAYPASVVRQNNLVLAEVGNNPGGGVNSVDFDDQSFTLIRNFPRFGVVSVQMKQSAQNLYNGSSNANNEWFDLIWGKAFTKMDFAVRLDVTNSSYEDNFNFGTAGKYEAKGIDGSFSPYPFGAFFSDAIIGTGIEVNTLGITPSIALHMANDNRLDIAATYRTYNLDRSTSGAAFATPQKWEDGGNASYAVLARYFMNKSAASQWYIAGWYQNDDLSWEVTGYTPTARSADETYKSYGVGISNNMRVNDNNLLLWGLSVWQSKHEYARGDNNDAVASGATKEFNDKSTMLPVLFAAVETQATNWLKLRIGGNNTIMRTESDFSDFNTPTNTENIKQTFTNFNLSLGAGLRWNNLDVDMTLNEEFPLSGGYILSGNEATPFTRVSGTYHF